jgi:hypothetical protein
MNRTERNLDKSGISIAPPMRPRAVTQTIAPAPTQAPSTRVRKQEPSGSETEIGKSIMNKSDIIAGRALEGGEFLVDGQQIQVDDVGDSEMGGVGYDAMGEGVGDGDEGDYGDGDRGMGYDENSGDGASQHVLESPIGGNHASWPGDVGYDQHMHDQHMHDPHAVPSVHLQVPKNPGFHRSADHLIPLDPDAIVDHFNTPRKHKRGRGRADSVESRQSKVNRQSVSHSSAAQSTMISTGAQSPAIPSTKISTGPQSPSPSVSPVGQDLQGASRTMGGFSRGRAFGNNPNWADSQPQNPFGSFAKPTGKVLLYTSRDKEAHPAMMITHETVSTLPPILEKMSRKFSPIRSK